MSTAIGKWRNDEKLGYISIEVTKGYEYDIRHGNLGDDWHSHLSTKTWMTPQLLADFDELKREVLEGKDQ